MLSGLDRLEQALDKGLAGIPQYEDLTPWEWVERKRKILLPGEADPTPFQWWTFQKRIFEHMNNPQVAVLALKLASRLGKTETVTNKIGYHIDEKPERILVMFPTATQVKKWAKENLEQDLFLYSGLTQYIGGQGRKGQEILHKVYPGGTLTCVGGKSEGEIRRAKAVIVFIDECDVFTLTDSGNDPIRLAEVRAKEFANSIIIKASYPSIEGESRIDAEYELSNKEKLMFQCTACQEYFYPESSLVRFKPEELEDARLECPHCKEWHNEQARVEMADKAEWIAEKPLKNIAGLMASQFVWPHPIDKRKFPGGFLQMIATDLWHAERARDPDLALLSIKNTCDAKSGKPATLNKPDTDYLKEHRLDITPRKELPSDVLFITAGIDIQDQWAAITWLGFTGKPDESKTYVLDYSKVIGDTSEPKFYNQSLQPLIFKQWKHPLYGHLPVTIAGIDSRHQTQQVYNYCKQHANIYAIEGSQVLCKPLIGKIKRKYRRTSVTVYVIGTDAAKGIVYRKANDLTLLFPNLATFNYKYFEGLISEEIELVRNVADAKYYRHFVNRSKRRNEPLDTAAYAFALEDLKNVDYERLRENLENSSEKSASEKNKGLQKGKNFATDI